MSRHLAGLTLAALALAVALAGCGPVQTPATVQQAAAQPASASAAPGQACRVVDGKADRSCTPGAMNPDVTPATIATTICRSGWTATVRPPASYTDQLKAVQMRLYGETGPARSVEEDHLIPLELGGAPRDSSNLWPEQWDGPTGAHAKDREENQLHADVCSGRMGLGDAQAKILADWSHA